MSKEVNVYVVSRDNSYDFEQAVENFINACVSELVDIKYSVSVIGYRTTHHALIIYR